jgi:AcrR family transcriptional regulator
MKRRGPRPGPSSTRDEILEAARATFAEVGYDRATIRRIAAAAGVDPSLVVHYFGKKEDLFAAAVKLPLRPEQAIDQVFVGGIDGAARRLSTLFFSIWENPESREALIGQLRMALTTGRPPPMRDFMAQVLLKKAAGLIEGPDPALRVELVASHLLGAAILRYVLELEPLASFPIDRLIDEISPRISTYLIAHPDA